MPDFEQAETSHANPAKPHSKRGHRRVTFLLKTSEYAALDAMAEAESRTADQQAMHLLRLAMRELEVRAIKDAVQDAEDRRRDGEIDYEADEVTAER